MSRGSNAVVEEDPWGDPAERYCPECGGRGVMTNVSMLIWIQIVAISGPRASSGVTAIRGHTQPGSPVPGVRCQVVTIARQRQETTHT